MEEEAEIRRWKRGRIKLLRSEAAVHIKHWVMGKCVDGIGDKRLRLSNQVAHSLEGSWTCLHAAQSRR